MTRFLTAIVYFDCADLIEDLMEVVQPALEKREESIAAKDTGKQIRRRVRAWSKS